MPNPEQEIQQVKQHIATVCARREQLKGELQTGVIAPRVGLARLEATDRELSALDSRFKQLWDAQQAPAEYRAGGAHARRITDPETGDA